MPCCSTRPAALGHSGRQSEGESDTPASTGSLPTGSTAIALRTERGLNAQTGENAQKKQAFEDLGAVLAVEGVDTVQFGPRGSSLSTGLVGAEKTHSAIAEAEQYVLETRLSKRIAPCAELNSSEGTARYPEMGVWYYCLGTDVWTLRALFKDQGHEMPGTSEGPITPSTGRQMGKMGVKHPKIGCPKEAMC